MNFHFNSTFKRLQLQCYPNHCKLKSCCEMLLLVHLPIRKSGPFHIFTSKAIASETSLII